MNAKIFSKKEHRYLMNPNECKHDWQIFEKTPLGVNKWYRCNTCGTFGRMPRGVSFAGVKSETRLYQIKPYLCSVTKCKGVAQHRGPVLGFNHRWRCETHKDQIGEAASGKTRRGYYSKED